MFVKIKSSSKNVYSAEAAQMTELVQVDASWESLQPWS